MSKLPATMHAVEIKEFGPAEGLVLTERPVQFLTMARF